VLFRSSANYHIYASSEMQGWRNTMEDSMIINTELMNDV